MDAWLIDKFDSATTRLQRRGYSLSAILLYEWNVQATSLIVSLGLTMGRFKWTYPAMDGVVLFILLLFGLAYIVATWMEMKRHDSERDYMENSRKTLKMNARVVMARDMKGTHRVFNLFLFTWLVFTTWALPPVTIVDSTIWTIFCVCVVLRDYLECCTFVGPGEHVRERQASFSRDMATTEK